MKIPNRKETIEAVRAKGYQIGAVMPFHYPRALLRAFKIHPMEVWGPPHIDPMEGMQHFPEYTCQIVHKATRFFATAAARDIDCILIPHTCDSLQGMASVLKDYLTMKQPIFTLYHPRGRRKSDLDYLENELRALGEKLREFTNISPGNDEIMAEIRLEEKANKLFADTLQHRQIYTVSDRDFYTTLRAGEYLPADQFIELVGSLPKGRADLHGPGLMLSGVVPEPMSIFDHINRFGAHVIIDDLACCSRRIYEANDESDPYRHLARSLMSMPPDTTISTPYNRRFEYLGSQMLRTGAKGVVVFNPKFCEPELFYISMFEERMKEQGYSFLFVENELTTELHQQIQTRINSFVEVMT